MQYNAPDSSASADATFSLIPPEIKQDLDEYMIASVKLKEHSRTYRDRIKDLTYSVDELKTQVTAVMNENNTTCVDVTTVVRPDVLRDFRNGLQAKKEAAKASKRVRDSSKAASKAASKATSKTTS